MASEDVNGLIEYHSEPLIDENLVKMTKSASGQEDDKDPHEEETEYCGFTLEGLQDLCNVAKDRQRRAQEMDNDMVQALHFGKLISVAMKAYKTIFSTKEKERQQLPITMLFTRKKLPAAKPASSVDPEDVQYSEYLFLNVNLTIIFTKTVCIKIHFMNLTKIVCSKRNNVFSTLQYASRPTYAGYVTLSLLRR